MTRVETRNNAEREASFASPELHTVFGITLVAVLGVASIAPALPRLTTELGLRAEQTGLLVTVFTLPGIFLTPVLGILADRIGRRRVLIPALLLFAVAGSACCMARSLPALLILRFIQGIGAAPLGSLNVTLIGDLFRGRQRTAAMGYNAAVLSIGTAAYPALGGALATVAWYYPFALPILALPVAITVGLRFRHQSSPPSQELGVYLGQVWREVRTRRVIALFVASTVIFVLLYGAYLTFFPFLMAERFTASPLEIGFLMSSLSLATAATSVLLGRLAAIMRERWIAVAGLVIMATGLALVPMMPSTILLVVPAVFLGTSFASTIPVVQTILAGLAPEDRRAAFMSLNGMVLRLGQTLGPVLMAAVYAKLGMTAVFEVSALTALALSAFLAWSLSPSRHARDSARFQS